MSSGTKLVIWVPDMSRETGWTGYWVDRDERANTQRSKKTIGFKQKNGRPEVE